MINSLREKIWLQEKKIIQKNPVKNFWLFQAKKILFKKDDIFQFLKFIFRSIFYIK